MTNTLKIFSDIGFIGALIFGILVTINIIWGDRSLVVPAAPSSKEITMERNFKRKDFQLTAEDFVKELSRHQTEKLAVYTKEVKEKRMSPREASKRYLIYQEVKELMELARARGLKMQDLKQMVEDTEIKSQGRQQQLFRKSQQPN